MSVFVAFRVWRSPNSWHIDDETKRLSFHAWPQLAMTAVFGVAFAVLTFLTL